MDRQFKTLSEKFQEQEQLANQYRMIQQLKEIADAAKEQAATAREQAVAAKEQAAAAREQADLAKQESESAKKEAHEAKWQSRINTCIAAVAVVVAFLAWLIPR